MMLAFTDNDHWRPGIGDPTVVGWITVVAYFVGAYLCWRAVWKTPVRAGKWAGERAFWSLFALGLVLLGINKQLDLQTWFTLFFKQVALHEGWYEQRRPVQALFIGAVALGGAATLVSMRRLAGKTTPPVRLALIGAIFLGCFILIRASSFHHVDRMLRMDFAGFKLNWLLELGSIAIIALAAALSAKTRPPVLSGTPDFIWVTAGDRQKPRPNL